MTNSIANPRSKPLIGARPRCAPSERLRKIPRESSEQYDHTRMIPQKRLMPPMSQNPHADSKIRLVLEHTANGRAVFYCVMRDAPGAKSANFGIKNRVRANAPKLERPVFIDIEPPAKVSYINRLTDQSSNWEGGAPAEPPVREGANLQRASARVGLASANSRPERPIHLYREEKVLL